MEFTRNSSYQSVTSNISNYDSNLSVSGASMRHSPALLQNFSMHGQFNYHRADETHCLNKRWVVCFTNQVQDDEKSTITLESVTSLFLSQKINLILICYDLEKEEIETAQAFIDKIK